MLSNGSQKSIGTQEFSQWMVDASKPDITSRQDANRDHHSTYTTGQTGHVDLISHFQQPPSDFATQDAELGASPQQDIHIEIFPEEQRFKQPETPVTNRKEGNGTGGDAALFATPRLPTNPFAKQAAHDAGIMGLSQIFKATQAPSSPIAARLPTIPSSDLPSPGLQVAIVNDLPSDIVSEYLSPIIERASRPVTAPSHSSPNKAERTPLQRAITEPHTQYISRKMSQEERQRQARLNRASSPIDKDSAIIDAIFEDSRDLDRHIKRRRVQRESKAVFDNIRAPSRRSAQESSKNQGVTGKASFKRSTTPAGGPSEVVVISDGANSVDSEDETASEDEAGPPVPSMESETDPTDENKENRGVAHVQVPMTGLRVKRASRLGRSNVPSSPSIRPDASTQKKDYFEDELTNKENPNHNDFAKRQGIPDQGRQLVTIVDSQSSQKIPCGLIPNLPKEDAVSSNNSRKVIPQSQTGRAPISSEAHASVGSRRAALSSQQTLSPPTTSPPLKPQAELDILQTSPRNISSGPTAQQIISPGSSPPLIPLRPGLPTILSNASLAGLGSSDDNNDNDDDNDSTGIEPLVEHEQRLSLAAREDQSSAQPIHNTQPHNDRLSSAPMPRFHSTIPETNSGQSRNSRPLEQATSSGLAPNSEVAQAHASRAEQNAFAPNCNEQSFRNVDGPTLVQKPPNIASPRYSRNSLPITPKRPSPRKPQPFTAIAPEIQEDEETDGIDLDLALFTVEDMNFREQMERLEGSSPVGPARKRRRGLGGRPVVPMEPSSISKTHSSPKGSMREASGVNQEPTIEQEDELATGVRTSPVAPRSLSVKSIKEVEAKQVGQFGQHSEPAKYPQVIKRSEGISRAATHGTAPKALAIPAVVIQPLKTTSKHSPAGNSKMTAHPLGRDKPVRRPQSSLESLQVHTTHVPSRIFAWFNGSPEGYFTATCLAAIGDPTDPTFKVRFDDGTVTVVNKVKRLELKEGDLVKVYRVGYRAQTYTVTGLQKDAARGKNAKGHEYPLTDVFGNQRVKVRPKRKKDSTETSREELVGMKDIYFTQQLWSNLKDREYAHQSLKGPASGLYTPSELSSLPSTPQSRMRSAKAASNLSTNQRPITASKSMIHQRSVLFDNIIFAMTNILNDHTRYSTQRSIADNGGTLLANGFEELFNVPNLGRNSSPSKPRPAKNSKDLPTSSASSNTTATKPSFAFTEPASHARFALLLADIHSRTTKYFEALALGIPCIHTRWVGDCVRAGRLQDWRPYLLASGNSNFLNGAVCSRTLSFEHHDGGAVSLMEMVGARDKWLKDSRVLLVGGGKANANAMGPYVLIAHALGAAEVGVVGERREAEEVLKRNVGEDWDW
ncbi:MAG: hypothetical protein LQ340_004601, partial [Diploschistes diacapsis]